jgi:hypothetical protein
MNAQRWEVLTLVGNFYENTWSEDGEPLTFATYAEAEAELTDHLEACEEAYQFGHLAEVPTRDQFAIAPYVERATA